MQIRYLCPKHENWVYDNPKEAIHFMARDELQGSLLLDQGQISEAIPYLGCALDIAFILLDVDGGQNNALTHKITMLCDTLSNIYRYLRLPSHCHAIETRLANTLNAVETASENSVNIACNF